jgi:uncharacterized repeat protein (TIGR03803 family)
LGKLNRGKRAYAVLALCAATAMALSAQTFTTLHSFEGTDGARPFAALVQATDGNFYGTSNSGGVEQRGTIFKISPSGALTKLYDFCTKAKCADGSRPGPLVQASDGDLYGTTPVGPLQAPCPFANGCGTVFKITLSGRFTTLHSFCSAGPPCVDGQTPAAGLLQAADGDLYGTTLYGGGNGTIFKITPSGALTTLYTFPFPCPPSGCLGGEMPSGGLVQATNGDLYGTTYEGGKHGAGTVFRFTPSGTLTTLYSFCSGDSCSDGSNPYADLVQGVDGDLYGVTDYGGAYSKGTVFKITPRGALTTLYSFCVQSGCPDGSQPYGGLVQATNGDFYGATVYGGANDSLDCAPYNCGTIFKITPGGILTTLYSFCGQSQCTDGYNPFAALVQATNGDFYGTTAAGGVNCSSSGGCGTIFRLSGGLRPFVKTLPTSGDVGQKIYILGSDLTDAASVKVNGTAANFRVISSSEIVAMVPAGATTGPVEVVTPRATLSSNVPFRVLPN